MPVYEYECQKCGVFETVRSFREKELKKCPKCGSAVKKIPSRPAKAKIR